jgi:hypothetical protein
MDTTATKIDENTVRIIKTVAAHDEVHEYKLDFLLKQKADIEKQRDDFVAAREAELKEVDHLIWHCEQEGIKVEEKPIEAVPIDNLPTLEEIIKPLIKTKK